MQHTLFHRLFHLALLAALLAGGLLAAFPPQPVRAATIMVNTMADDGPGNCSTTCTLRDAIASATNGDTIGFSVSGTITLTNGALNIQGKILTIEGPGASQLAISGNKSDRVFLVWDNYSGLTLSGLTIRDGYDNGADGGAIFNGSDNGGTLTVINTIFRDNVADGVGGAIWGASGSPLIVTNSTFSGNAGNGGDTTYSGGAIYSQGPMTVTNSTFSGNSAIAGGGIFNDGGSTLTVINSTFSGNSATNTGGGIYNGGTATVKNSIFANNATGGNCSGTITNSGNNLDDGTTCGFGSANGSLSSTDPQLGTLTGSPAYFPLNYNSPAIDGVTYNAPNSCPSADQRGQARDDLACDIGAYEVRYADTQTVMQPISSTFVTTFGPALMGLQRDAGFTNPGIITVTKSTSWVTLPTNGILTKWYITPTISSGFSLTMQLCYTGTELNGQTEGDLLFWRSSGGTVTQVGVPDSFTIVNGIRCATRSGITELSGWTLATGTPNAITLRDLTATANASPGIIGAVGAALAAFGALLFGRRKAAARRRLND